MKTKTLRKDARESVRGMIEKCEGWRVKMRRFFGFNRNRKLSPLGRYLADYNTSHPAR